MRHRSWCLDDIQHYHQNDTNNETGNGPLRFNNIRERKWGNSSMRFVPQFTVFVAIAAGAAVSCSVFEVDSFSTSSMPFHHRIRSTAAFDPSRRDSTARITSFNTPLVSFGNRLPHFVKTKLFLAKTGKSSEQSEWKAVLIALQLYKAAYGDLKVPKLFVVPSLSPWPEVTWGMKLGQTVGAIRDNGMYIDKSEKRRQQLESLGFVWRVRAPKNSAVDSPSFDIPFDQIYDALVAYRSEIKPSGPLTIPVEFTVPDADPWPESTRGLPLGRTVEQLRSKEYLDKNLGAQEKLQDIGFETDKGISANDKRFRAVFLALERYKEIYGDVLVPQPFVVPTDSPDWPEESWGLRLGARVNAIRNQGTFVRNSDERKEMLDRIGFAWTQPQKESVRRGGRETLSEIEAEEKEALIEASTSEAGPSGEDKDDDDMEFFLSFFDYSSDDESDDDSSSVPRTWGFVTEASGENKNETSTARDPYEMDVEEEYLSQRTLGESLTEARERSLESGVFENTDSKRAVKRKRDADIPWFNDDFGGDYVFDDVVEALTLYKNFYGGFSNLTNAEFVIPRTDEPQLYFETGENDYGNEMPVIAAQGSRFDEIDDDPLAEDQFDEEGNRLGRLAIAPESNMDSATLTPMEWPEHLEGMRLGDIVMRIRDGSLEVKHLPERKAQLDALDFDWGNPLHFIDVPFEKAMCAMYAYYLIRGDVFVPPEFIMLDEDPWPQALAGYELGKAVKRIRELQFFFEAFHLEKVGLLRMVDFVWFPTLALPIDPNEQELTSEMLIVGGLGHPDYYMLEEWQEQPFGLVDKIISGGQQYDVSEDPRKWWREWHNWEYVEDLWYNVGTRDRAVQLRRGGFPQLAGEHEAKYGPGFFQQLDEFLDDFVTKLGKEGFVRILGTKDAENYLALSQFLESARKEWPVDNFEEQNKIMDAWDRGMFIVVRNGLFGSTVKSLFDKLDGTVFRGIPLADPELEFARKKLYDYLDELRDCIDIPHWELRYVWENRIKLLLCVVQAEKFRMLKATVESVPRKAKKRLAKAIPRTSDDKIRSELDRIEETGEDIYDETENEEENEVEFEKKP